jgi:large subunit ribosomal protein L23
MNRMGKDKNMTVRSGGRTIRTQGSKASWKKAIVTLKEGNSINLLEGEAVE